MLNGRHQHGCAVVDIMAMGHLMAVGHVCRELCSTKLDQNIQPQGCVVTSGFCHIELTSGENTIGQHWWGTCPIYMPQFLGKTECDWGRHSPDLILFSFRNGWYEKPGMKHLCRHCSLLSSLCEVVSICAWFWGPQNRLQYVLLWRGTK